MTITSQHLTPAELRTLFLFEALDDDKLDWLAGNGVVEQHPAGAHLFTATDPATCFYVLLSGTIQMSRAVDGTDVEVNRTDYRGSYFGATQAWLAASSSSASAPVSASAPADGGWDQYGTSVRALTDVTCFTLPANEFGAIMKAWFPMAVHLLEGLFLGMRASQAMVGQRERLTALGRLTAGLTHELNNPAAAAVRATSMLRERVAAMRHKLGALASGKVDPATLTLLSAMQEEAIEKAAKAKSGTAPELTALQASDREDELSDWFDDHGLTAGWQLAPILVASGLTAEWLDTIAGRIPPDYLDGGLRWITYALESEQLMSEIEEATERISALVGAAKQYSQMDRAAHQNGDLHTGLDSTLVMLGRKVPPSVTVVKDYDKALPAVPMYAAELNQVWTNLIDNAIQAMDGAGTLTVRTRRDGEFALVEIGDTGPGVAPDLVTRIFEPFFTTKGVGKGTGLGLDISWRIVANRHGGDLRVVSQPGDTWFQARLPLVAPAAPPTPTAPGGAAA
jgi:signal transduction histidine kinase